MNMSGWWFGTFFVFPYTGIGNGILPIDVHIFQRGRYTTNQGKMNNMFFGQDVVDVSPPDGVLAPSVATC